MSIAAVMRTMCGAMLIGFVVGGCAMKTPSGTIDFERIKADMDKKAQIVSRFRVDFTRIRRSSVFNRPITAQGRLVVQKPDRFRIVMCGDVNVEILSDGRMLAVIHDRGDKEIHTLHGDRDRALFADPLMALLEGFGSGSLKQVTGPRDAGDPNMVAIEIPPRNSSRNDRKHQVLVWFNADGTIDKARFVADRGDNDELQVRSWAVLTANDPDLAELERRLQQVKAAGSTVPDIGESS